MPRIVLLLWFSLGICWLLLTPSAQAQGGGLMAAPTRISVAGVTGERITRTTVIRATTPISNVQGLATDLSSEQSLVIPAAQISVQTSASQLPTDGVMTVTTTFDLRGITSGAYQGDLLLAYDNGVMNLPVTVQVKHHWGWALIVLLLGIAGGGVLTYYRQQVRPYDEILIRVGRLRSQIRNAPELVKSFQEEIERLLIDVEAALQSADLAQARSSISQAEAIWVRWRRDHTNWLALNAFSTELEQRIANEQLPHNSAYIRKIAQNLKDVVRNAAVGSQTPAELLGCLKEQEEALADYKMNYDQLQTLSSQSSNAPLLQQEARALETRLNNLDPSDSRNRSLLKEDLKTLADKIAMQATDAQPEAHVLGGARSTPTKASIWPAILIPEIINTSEAAGQQATTRRSWELWLSSGFLLILLALVGLGQLYGNNATFGANIWSDYATLLAWGLGIEASRSAIVGLGGK